MGGLHGKALIAQGGGPTAVINQSLVGAILELKKNSGIEKVFGAHHGVSGVKKEDFIDLSEISEEKLELVANTPGSSLGTTRDKPDGEYCTQMFEVMQKHDIRYFYYIGGNDSADTCRIVNEEAQKQSYELRVIHIPKTIDNDLQGTDHCPGYGSAARFIALAFKGINLDNRALPGVYIGILMGRHAGFLTAASVLSKQFEDDGPHLIYTPEKVFNVHYFVRDIKEIYGKYGRCVVAVSEGVVDEDGMPITAKLAKQVERDAHGNVQLSGSGVLGDLLCETVKSHTDISRVRVDTFGYLQRSFLGCVSEVDSAEAREVGKRAVQFSLAGDVDGSIAIKRISEYAVGYELIQLESVAAKTKVMPDDFFESDTMVGKKFEVYARPLVGNLDQVGRLDI